MLSKFSCTRQQVRRLLRDEFFTTMPLRTILLWEASRWLVCLVLNKYALLNSPSLTILNKAWPLWLLILLWGGIVVATCFTLCARDPMSFRWVYIGHTIAWFWMVMQLHGKGVALVEQECLATSVIGVWAFYRARYMRKLLIRG